VDARKLGVRVDGCRPEAVRYVERERQVVVRREWLVGWELVAREGRRGFGDRHVREGAIRVHRAAEARLVRVGGDVDGDSADHGGGDY